MKDSTTDIACKHKTEAAVFLQPLVQGILVTCLLLMGGMATFGQDEKTPPPPEKGERIIRPGETGRPEKVREPERVIEEERIIFEKEFNEARMEEFKRQAEIDAKRAQLEAREMELQARAFHYGSQNNSQLMLSKNYSGTDAENEGVFQIEKSVRQIRFSIEGSVREGSITVKLLLPGGDVFKELTIDESADVRFSQSLVIMEDENKYSGNWKYTIKARNADGNYRLSISTN